MAILRDKTDDWYHKAIVKYQYSCLKCYIQAVVSETLLLLDQLSWGTFEHNKVSGHRSLGLALELHSDFVTNFSSSLRELSSHGILRGHFGL